SGACGDPGGAVQLGEAGGFLPAVLAAALLAVVVEGEDFDAFDEGALDGGVDGLAAFLGGEFAGHVLEGVEADDVGVGLLAQAQQDAGVLDEVLRWGAGPEDEVLVEEVAVFVGDHAGHGAGGLLGRVAGEVEDALGGADGESEGVGADADGREEDLLADGGLSDAWGARDDERVAFGPQDVVVFAPDGGD